MTKQAKRKGFTLVELLVVIAILAILATVSVVGYTSFMNKARQSNCDSEAYQVEQAINAALMIPDGEYVISSSTSDSTTTTYVVKAAHATSETSDYIAIWKVVVNSSSTTYALATSDEVKSAFAANTDFADLAKKGDFTIGTDCNKSGKVVITYTYKDYTDIKADITIDTTIVK